MNPENTRFSLCQAHGAVAAVLIASDATVFIPSVAQQYRQRRYVVVASPHGEEPTVTIYGDFFSDEAAARWAGKHVPSGHDWVVALINRPRRQGWGHDQTGLVNDQHDGSCL